MFVNVAVVVSKELRKKYGNIGVNIFCHLLDKMDTYSCFDEESLAVFQGGDFLSMYDKLNIYEIYCLDGENLVIHKDTFNLKIKDTDRVYIAACDNNLTYRDTYFSDS